MNINRNNMNIKIFKKMNIERKNMNIKRKIPQ